MWNIRTGVCEMDLLTALSGVWQVRFGAEHCVAAVQRGNVSYIKILDFGASIKAVSSRVPKGIKECE
ncbi:hypothetical protein N7494_005349 [Penicillium frequentans]|uniref:Uncharacterized protein n=1 Tax=Penicillium frequentans TaxID=3151616 RepID=A0AAD6CY72_9EURO|nr:hypothetical protein N7494_005349 [Penicillium glabrum]